MDLSDWRDIAVIAYSVAGTLAFTFFLIFTVIIGFVTWRTISRVNGILKTSVQPALNNVRDTTESVRGSVTFISDNAVKPVVKTYGVYAGARRFISVLARFRSPRRAT